MSNKLFAIAIPILPGKTESWKSFAKELTTTYKNEFDQSRQKLGVQERTFLQHTPMGDLILVTLQGDNPAAAFGEFAKGNDEFTKWFVGKAKELHGIDLANPPAGALPEQVIDSGAVHAHASA